MSTTHASSNIIRNNNHTIKQNKKQLRKQINDKLNNLSDDIIQYESNNVINQLINNTHYQQAKSLCCYISMSKELQTNKLIEHALNNSKKVYVPHVVIDKKRDSDSSDIKQLQSSNNDMHMYRVYSIDDINTLPINNYGIKQPNSTYCNQHNNTTIQRDIADNDKDLSLIVVPCVALNNNTCDRLGHGKGYYDKYIKYIQQHRYNNNLSCITAIGICLSCQLCNDIPTHEHDVKLDHIIHPK